MNKLFWLIILLVSSLCSYAQELNATVNINYNQLGNSNASYFTTLEKSLREFINTTSWGTRRYNTLEKIDCVFILNVSSLNNNIVSGTLQIQSTRPVFNTTYSTPVLNFNDKDIAFSYIEFENLVFNPNSSDSNLTNLIGFYANLIIGLDADTFKANQGSAYLQSASSIVNSAQQSNYKGWKQADGNANRYSLINDLVSNSYSEFIEALYIYHRKGLDVMAQDNELGRQGIYQSLVELNKLQSAKGNSFLMRVFFDAKTTELQNLYTGISDPNKKKVVDLLKKLSPLNTSKWNSL